MNLYTMFCNGFDSVEFNGLFVRHVEFKQVDDLDAASIALTCNIDGTDLDVFLTREDLESASYHGNGSWMADNFGTIPMSITLYRVSPIAPFPLNT